MRRLIALLLAVFAAPMAAQDLYMVRSQLSFPEAMTVLQEAIREQGYTLSRVQRVDIGLTASGYETDKYRVVFFGRRDDLDHLGSRHVGLVAHFPLKIAIYAEGEDTVLLAAGLQYLRDYYAEKEISAHLQRWENDIADILEVVRKAQ